MRRAEVVFLGLGLEIADTDAHSHTVRWLPLQVLKEWVALLQRVFTLDFLGLINLICMCLHAYPRILSIDRDGELDDKMYVLLCTPGMKNGVRDGDISLAQKYVVSRR